MKETLNQTSVTIDKEELEKKVKDMYRDVALNPKGEFHFEMGRELLVGLSHSL